MTDFARRREAGGGMRRIGRACVVLLVARIAERAVEVVVIVDVAVGAQARRNSMRSRQLEASGGVVKRTVAPLDRVMAGFACSRKRRRDVIHGRERVVVVVLMARHACRAAQVVVVVDMAIGALPRRHRMRSRQRKSGAVVIERRIEP